MQKESSKKEEEEELYYMYEQRALRLYKMTWIIAMKKKEINNSIFSTLSRPDAKKTTTKKYLHSMATVDYCMHST